MFSSIIQNISKPFQKSQGSQSHSGSTGDRRNDRLEDGFLLVGDTASERTIVNTRDFNADRVDAPPTYRNFSRDCLPSYQEYTSSMTGQSPTLDASQFPHLQHGNPFSTGSTTVVTGRLSAEQQGSGLATGFTDNRSGRTAISDVPFELANSLQFSSSVHDLYSSNIFQQKSFDFSVYDYNFNLERSFLNEHEIVIQNDEMDISN